MTIGIDPGQLRVWAGYLLDYSLGGIRPDDVVMVKGEHCTWPLLSVLEDEIFAAGAIADMNLVAPNNDRGRVFSAAIARHGTLEQIRRVPAWHHARYEAMTKYVEVLGSEAPALFTALPDATARALVSADEPFKNVRLAKPWCLTLYPTAALAAIEGLTLDEYTRTVVQASTTDPRHLEELEEPLYRALAASRRITIVTAHPDGRRTLELTMSVAGQRAVKCTGKRNFPDGEVFTSPDAGSVEGEIYVDLPVCYAGTMIQGVHLRFAGGEIVEYAALRGQDALATIIETDPGSRRLGEVALGMNRGFDRVLTHPLFVEKVGGTLHIAIGASYPEAYVEDAASEEGKAALERARAEGRYNASAQHVDIVADFRPGGAGRAVYLDDLELRVRDGLWAVP